MSNPRLDVKVHQRLPLKLVLQALETASFAVLHAAIYSNFADNAVGKMLQEQLRIGQLKQLYILQLQPHAHWQDEFAAILRPKPIEKPAIPSLYQQSHAWCQQLQEQFPHQLHFHLIKSLPLQPILLIGNRIFAGQYAHSQTTSADGLWLEIAVAEQQQIATRFLTPKLTTTLDNITLRYIDECRFAYQQCLS
ncbi:hypothetical protein J8L86_15845 [Shewanella sp. MMG014]|uniref:hypothetical protein n=1 Tax=Shewanella sp. MMG014 TaxID=2822691 RepID=UPI001B38F22D|nr:hypothetical protein [Shewanella sp. MMG014]MBQ4891327.1 hypothetical protein [Shewanella sp. MMG014]